jgi:hypothetical protein
MAANGLRSGWRCNSQAEPGQQKDHSNYAPSGKDIEKSVRTILEV